MGLQPVSVDRSLFGERPLLRCRLVDLLEMAFSWDLQCDWLDEGFIVAERLE